MPSVAIEKVIRHSTISILTADSPGLPKLIAKLLDILFEQSIIDAQSSQTLVLGFSKCSLAEYQVS